MPVDDRIRAGLSRNAEVPLPPVEHHLDVVVRRHRRRTTARLVAGAAAVAVLGLLPVWSLTTLTDRDPDPARPAPHALAGTYLVVIDDVGAASELRGTWEVTLTKDGLVDLTPPPAYGGTVSDGAAYEVSGATVTTNVFVDLPGCQRDDPAVGVYRVALTASGADFTLLEDTCAARAALFGVRWERLP